MHLPLDRFRDRHVDYFLAGIAGRGFTRDYTRRILRVLEPKVVIPHHFDDFFRPLGGEPRASIERGPDIDKVASEVMT